MVSTPIDPEAQRGITVQARTWLADNTLHRPVSNWQQYAKVWQDRNPQTPAAMDALYRTNFGTARSVLNQRFLADVPDDVRILEIGSCAGVQLDLIFEARPVPKWGPWAAKLYGCDLSSEVLADNIWHPVTADMLRLPYATASFDLVFTSGALMHVPPDFKDQAMREMRRVTKRWIWGFELRHVNVNGQRINSILDDPPRRIQWKGEIPDAWVEDYPAAFAMVCPDLRLVRLEAFTRAEDIHIMYLLEVRKD